MHQPYGKSAGKYPTLTVGQLAKRTGVAASALRFYEDRGLIRSERTESGHRRYVRATTRQVAFIVFAQRAGLTLEEIRVELEKLPSGRPPRGDEWARLSAMWSARITERIEELQRLQARPHDLHRMWLSLAREMPDPQSRRPRRVARSRPPLLDG